MKESDQFIEAFRTIDLQRLQIASQMSCAEEVAFNNPQFEAFRDYMAERLVVQLRAYIWADPPQEISCRYPRDWWQAVKERWFPKWALERWPVEYQTTTLQAQTIYPRLQSELPQHQAWLRMAVMNPRTSPFWWEESDATQEGAK